MHIQFQETPHKIPDSVIDVINHITHLRSDVIHHVTQLQSDMINHIMTWSTEVISEGGQHF